MLIRPAITKTAGRNFDLSSRLPITLMMMAVAVTFSPALPVLFPMVSVYLIITYFGDKFHLLRSCCTPPQVRQDHRVVIYSLGVYHEICYLELIGLDKERPWWFEGQQRGAEGRRGSMRLLYALQEDNRCTRLPESQGCTGVQLPAFVCSEPCRRFSHPVT